MAREKYITRVFCYLALNRKLNLMIWTPYLKDLPKCSISQFSHSLPRLVWIHIPLQVFIVPNSLFLHTQPKDSHQEGGHGSLPWNSPQLLKKSQSFSVSRWSSASYSTIRTPAQTKNNTKDNLNLNLSKAKMLLPVTSHLRARQEAASSNHILQKYGPQ